MIFFPTLPANKHYPSFSIPYFRAALPVFAVLHAVFAIFARGVVHKACTQFSRFSRLCLQVLRSNDGREGGSFIFIARTLCFRHFWRVLVRRRVQTQKFVRFVFAMIEHNLYSSLKAKNCRSPKKSIESLKITNCTNCI